MNGKRYKVVLFNDSPIHERIETSFDLDFGKISMKIRDRYLEFGWAEVVRTKDGKLEVKLTLAGNYEIDEEATLDDLLTLKGTLPTSREASGEMTE